MLSQVYVDSYQETIAQLERNFDAKSRKKRNPKDIKCKRGQEVVGAVCKDVKKGAANKISIASKVIASAAAATATALTGLSKAKTTNVSSELEALKSQTKKSFAKLGAEGKKAVETSIGRLEQDLGRKLPEEVKNIVNENALGLENAFGNKKPSFAEKLVKQAAIELSSDFVGTLGTGVYDQVTGGTTGAIGNLAAGTVARRGARHLITERYGNGFQSKKGQYATRYGTRVAKIALDLTLQNALGVQGNSGSNPTMREMSADEYWKEWVKNNPMA